METRLQRLRRMRSEQLKPEVDAELQLLQNLKLACTGCGTTEGYTLDCASCWSRAYDYVRRHGPNLEAERFLATRRSYSREKLRQLSEQRHVAPAGEGARGARLYDRAERYGMV